MPASTRSLSESSAKQCAVTRAPSRCASAIAASTASRGQQAVLLTIHEAVGHGLLVTALDEHRPEAVGTYSRGLRIPERRRLGPLPRRHPVVAVDPGDFLDQVHFDGNVKAKGRRLDLPAILIGHHPHAEARQDGLYIAIRDSLAKDPCQALPAQGYLAT